MKQEYLVYVVESTNDYIAYCGFDTEEEARKAAQRMTLDVDYPEILSVGVHNHPDEDPDDGSWRRIAVYCCGEEWVPLDPGVLSDPSETGDGTPYCPSCDIYGEPCWCGHNGEKGGR